MKREIYTGYIKNLKKNEIFVFGSNPEGRHGAGTAKLARLKYGAIYGQGRGIQGRSYGLITKNLKKNYIEEKTGIKYERSGKRSISKDQIVKNIKELYIFARKNKTKKFFIAYTGGEEKNNNLNGYSNKEMASFFREAKPIPSNIIFEEKFNNLVYP